MKSSDYSASACGYDPDALRSLCWSAGASIYTDGAVNGGVSVEWLDVDLLPHRIECSGASFQNVVTVDHRGNVGVSAVLDPFSSDCIAFDVSLPVTLSFTGRGVQFLSQHSTTKQFDGQTTVHYNFQTDCFHVTYTGTTNVSDFDNFSGGACSGKNNTRIKNP